jgi:hypothetical protein
MLHEYKLNTSYAPKQMRLFERKPTLSSADLVPG